MLKLLAELIANFLAPWGLYEALAPRLGDTRALIASALPPLLWNGYELLKTRRLDAISLLVAASILFSLAATALGGSARLIQIRDALVTGAIGLIFLGSLLTRRPVVFYLARATMARNTAQGVRDFERVWGMPGVPRLLKIITAAWGCGLVAQTATLCWLAWHWPIGRYLLVSPVIVYGVFGLLLVWSLWFLASHGETGRAIFQRG